MQEKNEVLELINEAKSLLKTFEWQHYKGEVYGVEDVVIKEDSVDLMVIYMVFDHGRDQVKWARKLSDFMAYIGVGRTGYTGHRFRPHNPSVDVEVISSIRERLNRINHDFFRAFERNKKEVAK